MGIAHRRFADWPWTRGLGLDRAGLEETIDQHRHGEDMLVIARWIGLLNRLVEDRQGWTGGVGREGSWSVRRYIGPKPLWTFVMEMTRGTHVIDKHPSLGGDPCQFGGVLSPSGRGVEHLRQRAGKRFHLVTLLSTSDKRLTPVRHARWTLPMPMPMPMPSRPRPPPPFSLPGPSRIQHVRMDCCVPFLLGRGSTPPR